MNMMNKAVLLNNKLNTDKINLFLINKVAEIYNNMLYMYTKNFKGRIPVPKTDISKIPKKYISINEYINSKPIWRQILKFTREMNNIDISDYLNVMLRNWRDIALRINKPDQLMPLSNIIFSLKIAPLYYTYKEREKLQEELNKHLCCKKSDDFYRLTPSLQSNVNSLFKLKKLNPNISYHDIVDIFKGEFEDEFVKCIKQLDESEITVERLTSMFK